MVKKANPNYINFSSNDELKVQLLHRLQLGFQVELELQLHALGNP